MGGRAAGVATSSVFPAETCATCGGPVQLRCCADPELGVLTLEEGHRP